MSLFEILIKAHSGLRWLVLAAAIVGIIVMAWKYQKFGRVWMAVYSGLLDVQVVLGFVIFFMLAARPSLWHPVLMTLAAVSAHVGALLARRQTDRRRLRGVLLAYVLSYLLVVYGLTFVPRGFGF